MTINNLTDLKSLFFDNKTLKQTIFKNTFWLGVGLGADRMLRLILLVYAARILGATDYGKFTFALAFLSLIIIFSDFGLDAIIIREFAREKDKQEEFYSVISLKILLSLGAFIIILLSSFFISQDPNIQRIILILGIFSLAESFIGVLGAFFHAHQRMEYQAWITVLQSLLMTGIGLFLLFKFPSVDNLSYSYLVASIFALIFTLVLFHFKFLPFKICWQKSVWRKFLSMSWPMALVGLFSNIYINIDSAMMGYWGMLTETGWYNAAYRLVSVVIIPGALISRSFAPILSEFFKESKEMVQKAWNQQMDLMIMFAIPLMVGGIVLAPRIIYTFYPLDFGPSVLAFQILIIMGGTIFFYRPFTDVMVAANQQKKIFWISLSGAIVNIILNFILIPKYSLYGAAVATVITYILILLLYFMYTAKLSLVSFVQVKSILTFIIALASSFLMYLTIKEPLIYNLNVFLSIPLGGLVYFLAFFGLEIILKTLKLYDFKR